MALCLVVIVGMSMFLVPGSMAVEITRAGQGHQVLYGYHDHGEGLDQHGHHGNAAIIIRSAPDYGNLALLGEAMNVKELQDQLEARDRWAQAAGQNSRTDHPSHR